METISVKEYAKIKGISYQAVHKKMKSPKFQPYVIQENGGQKRLDIAILDDPEINGNATKYSTRHSTVESNYSTVEQPFKTPENPSNSGAFDESQDSTVERDFSTVEWNYSTVDSTVEQPLKSPENAPESPLEKELRNRVLDKEQEIERLVAQLSAKEKEMDRLAEQIDRKDAQIMAKDEQIRSLQESLQAAQLIQAKQMQIQIPEKTESASAENKGFLARLKDWWNSTTPQQ